MRRHLYVPCWVVHRWKLPAGLLVLALLLGLAAGALAQTSDDQGGLLLTIPFGSERALLVMAATRAIPDELGGTGVTFYDLQVRVGREDRVHDTYEQLVDATLPLWPP